MLRTRLLFLIKQRPQRFAQMPLHIVSQNADEKMCAHARLDAMTNLKISVFQLVEGLFDLGQILVAVHHLFRRELLAVLTGAQSD